MPARPGQTRRDAGQYQRKPHGKPEVGARGLKATASLELPPRPDFPPEVPPLFATYDQPKPEGAWFDEEAAQRVVDFVQSLRHYIGKHNAQPFWLQPWQERIVRELFGWKRVDGTRLYRKLYLEVPRKSGKTTLAAAIALYLAFADDEPGCQVYFAAADKDQATACYEPARIMAEEAHSRGVIGDLVPYNSTKEIKIPDNPGAKLKALSSDTTKLYGLNLHGLVFDELMAQKNRTMWDALTTSQGARRQPLIVAITTAGWDKQSIAYEHREQTRRIAEDATTVEDFLGVVYSAPEDADWTDPAAWRAAQPSMGWTVDEDYYRRAVEEAKEQPGAQNAVRTLYLSQWVGQADRVIDMEAWDRCAEPPVADGPAWGGLDLAATTDLTAFVLAFCDEDGAVSFRPYFFMPKLNMRSRGQRDGVDYEAWEREGLVIATPGAVTDYGVVKRTILEAAEQYDIQSIGYDRWGAIQLAQELAAEGLNMVAVGQGFASMSAPTKELLRLVAAGQVRHGGHKVLRWNADNAAAAQDPAGNVKPAKDRSAGRIDGIVAAVMATDGMMRAPKASRSVYETRGPDDIWEMM